MVPDSLDVPEKARMLEAQIRPQPSSLYSKLHDTVFLRLGIRRARRGQPECGNSHFPHLRTGQRLVLDRTTEIPLSNHRQHNAGISWSDLPSGLPAGYSQALLRVLRHIDPPVHCQARREPTDTLAKNTLGHPNRTTQPYKNFSSTPALGRYHDGSGRPLYRPLCGPTQRLPLGTLVHARSGDKGSDCNCGFWISRTGSQPFSQETYDWLRSLLSTVTMKTPLVREYDPSRTPKIEIERFELANLGVVHVHFRNLLDRGVTSTATVDFLGKNVAEFLRARYVDIPVRFLERGSRLQWTN